MKPYHLPSGLGGGLDFLICADWTPDQALANRAAGKLSFALGIENGAAIQDQLANLAHFAARGVRYVTLTHGKNNLICDSSYETPESRLWHGLSPFGREVVAEMNRLGMMVDRSHVSDEAFDQADMVAVIARGRVSPLLPVAIADRRRYADMMVNGW